METMESLAETAGDPPPMDDGHDAPTETVAAEAVPPPRRPAPKPRAAVQPRTLKDLNNEIELKDNQEIRDWIDELAAEGEIKVSISRKSPRLGAGGENVMGHLETVEDKIDNDYIREMWGGGVFSLMIQTPGPNGRWKIARRIQLSLAGEPKMEGRTLGRAAAPHVEAGRASSSDPIVKMAFESTQQQLRDAQQRMDTMGREDRRGGLDAHAVASLTAPYQNQVVELMQTIRDLQSRLADQANRPPPVDPFRDKLMMEVVTGDRSEAEKVRRTYEDRMQAQQERYEQRIDDQARTHREDIKRMEERHDSTIKLMEMRHLRELGQTEKLGDGQKTAEKFGYEAKVEAMRETISRLERELTTAASKIGTLESKKDQSIKEKAEELLAVQEVVGELGGDKGEPKWYEKVLDVMGNSEAAMNIINRIAGPGPAEQTAQPQQQQQAAYALPPPGVPYQVPGDPNVYVRDGEGQVHIVQQRPRPIQAAAKKKQQQRKKAPAVATEGGEPAESGDDEGVEVAEEGDDGTEGETVQQAPQEAVPSGRPPKPEEIASAVAFLENAIRGSNPNPEILARGARALIPGDLLTFMIQHENVDTFVNRYCKLQAGSPLTSVKGRQFMRALHKALREGG